MKLMNGKWISVRLFKVCISLGEGERDAKKKAGTTWVSITLIPTLDDIKYGCLFVYYYYIIVMMCSCYIIMLTF